MNKPIEPYDFVSFLPEIVWYLSGNGSDMWCRRPYGFLFTTSEAAVGFAGTVGSEFELTPIGLQRQDLMSKDVLTAVRQLGVNRLFLDPTLDQATGDVVGKILRLEPMQ
jgi:hypothetical protein